MATLTPHNLLPHYPQTSNPLRTKSSLLLLLLLLLHLSKADTTQTSTAYPPTFDLGNLMTTDPGPLSPHPPDTELHTRAQQCAQALIAHLLTHCPIHPSPHDATSKALLMTLPGPTTPLPREKPLPRPREKTRWERFAERKGINNTNTKKGDRRGGEAVGGNKVYDEASGEWVVAKYGYNTNKGRNQWEGQEWIVEVDEAEEAGLKEGETVRGQGRRERKEKARRRERKERANERSGRKGGV